MSRAELPFNRPYRTGAEPGLVLEALSGGWTGGNGPFSGRCEQLLVEITGARRALLTPSCTAALEMAAVLAEVGPGDEVILPSFTFVSTANAFVLRGATPVFVEIRRDTLTMDAEALADAVTPATRAVVPVHYAGGACDMDDIATVARRHDLIVVEDAAQGVGATWRDRPLGALGALGALSFHETKNVSCGEGGALLINDDRFAARAEVVQEKGTNRAGFARGEVDHYTWVDLGSSLPDERRHGGAAACPARARCGDHRGAAPTLGRLSRRVRADSSARAGSSARASPLSPNTTATSITYWSPSAPSATSSSAHCGLSASRRTSTTCRCTALLRGSGSDARTASWSTRKT